MRLNRFKIFLIVLLSLLAPYLVAKVKDRYSPSKTITFHESTTDSSIIYLFVHGLGATGQQAKRYEGLMSNGAIAHFDFLDAKPKPDDYHSSLVNLGQEDDIARLKEVYDSIEKEHPECASIVLIGVSRGAVTILNFMAQHRPEKVKALVVESPFDTYTSIIRHLIDGYLKWLKWIPGIEKLGNEIFCKNFPAFNKNGLLPINKIEQLPHVPTLFIHSHCDELIPVTSSENLYNMIAHRGNVHLVTLNGARHAHLIVHDECKRDYENAVHAFYKKYDLPCDNQKADVGKVLFS